MTEGLSERQVQWLTYLVWLLLTVVALSVVASLVLGAANRAEIDAVKKDYVRRDDYQCTIDEIKSQNNKIIDKIDKLSIQVIRQRRDRDEDR